MVREASFRGVGVSSPRGVEGWTKGDRLVSKTGGKGVADCQTGVIGGQRCTTLVEGQITRWHSVLYRSEGKTDSRQIKSYRVSDLKRSRTGGIWKKGGENRGGFRLPTNNAPHKKKKKKQQQKTKNLLKRQMIGGGKEVGGGKFPAKDRGCAWDGQISGHGDGTKPTDGNTKAGGQLRMHKDRGGGKGGGDKWAWANLLKSA